MVQVGKEMKLITLRFYGVKFVNNTSGVDEIIASRMFRIVSRKLTGELKKELNARRADIMSPRDIVEWQNNLHTWSFSNTDKIDECYRVIMAEKVNWDDEISAPLKVLARLANCPEITQDLEVALRRREDQPTMADESVAMRGYQKYTGRWL
jgi:hypothetical protein